MQKGLIKLAYRQVIDADNKGNFERSVLSISMVANDPKANSLHYKSGFAIGNLIEQLNKKIPELQDTLGKNLDFEMHAFEVIDSDITNLSAHKVAITYITGILTFYGNMGEYMLLAAGDKLNQTSTEPVETFLLKVQHSLSVINYQQF